jgi:hypothetical protein
MSIVPKKIKDGDNDASITPLSVTGTTEDLGAELSTRFIRFVGSHLRVKNTPEKAKAEMDAASKAAHADAPAKSKTPAKTASPNAEVTQYAPTAKPTESVKTTPQKPARLFDMQAPAVTAAVTPAESDEDPGFAEIDDDAEPEEFEELDDTA